MMANYGKIEYTPYPSRALAPTGAYHLLLAEESNLIGVNPGAETGDLTGWSDSVCFVDSGSAYAGTYNFQLIGGNLTSDADNHFDLERNRRYKINFAAKSAGGQMALYVLDKNGQIVTYFLGITPTATWQLLSYNFTSSRDYSDCYLYFVVNSGLINIDSILISQEYLDFGTESFTIDLLWQPFAGSGAKYLARKASDDSFYGWALYYDHSDYKYYFRMGTGTSYFNVSSAAVSAVQNYIYHWLQVTVDRATNLVSFFVNGSISGTAQDISTALDNVSVTNALNLFGVSAGYKAIGQCDFIRFRRGTPLDATWRAAEWGRIQAGLKRNATSADALWDFNDNLIDQGQGLILTASAGTPAYADGWPYGEAPVTYNFDQNFSYGHSQNDLEMHNIFRSAPTGRASLNPGEPKKEIILPFTGVIEAQTAYLNAASQGGQPIKLWLDSDKDPVGNFYCLRPPRWISIPYFGDNGEQLYEGDFELTEV